MDDLIKNRDEDERISFLHEYHLNYINNFGSPYEQSEISFYANRIEAQVTPQLEAKISQLEDTEDDDELVELEGYQTLLDDLPDEISALKFYTDRYQNFSTKYNGFVSASNIRKLKFHTDNWDRIFNQHDDYMYNDMLFWQSINVFFVKYDLNLILYDEVEKFREWNDDQFKYPYQDRKTTIANIYAPVHEVGNKKDEYNPSWWDYEIPTQEIRFKVSDVCLEGNYTD